jgi:tetraacyldisaccharide 4'-kinase
VKIIQIILLALPACLYGLGVRVRNFLFDIHVLKSRIFSGTVISVGNITVGGTGKTPHIEYLVRLLSPKHRVAVLSRGYLRQSKGFQLADEHATAQSIGDESLQIYSKFPDCLVAVDKKRVNGIERLYRSALPPDVTLLDDAFQHRWVKPQFSILTIDYHRPLWRDHLLPLGRLREPKSSIRRADAVIVSKCPKELSDETMSFWRNNLHLQAHQRLFFSTVCYHQPTALFSSQACPSIWQNRPDVLVVTGIVSAKGLYDYLKPLANTVYPMPFADHHPFSRNDWHTISQKFETISHPDKVIVVTEKDKVRLMSDPALPDRLKPHLYSVGIEIRFSGDTGETFDKIVNEIIR